jgi:type IV pilus assembly protein PilZ
MSDPTASKMQVLTLAIKDKAVLFAAFMQFITQGGIFIPTQRPFQWGEEVTLALNLMEETEKYNVRAKVVWITPVGAQGNRAPGIGVQFLGDEGQRLRNKMETYLAGALNTDRPTHTL